MPNTDESNLPRGWSKTVRSGVLHALVLVNVILANVASKKRGATGDLHGDRENAVLREIDDIRRARMERVPPHRRPHYTAIERMRILELKAAQSWSTATTAEMFQITEPTVADWLNRIDEANPNAIVRLALCSTLGPHARQSRRKPGTRGRVLSRPPRPAHHYLEARCLIATWCTSERRLRLRCARGLPCLR